MPAAVSQYPAHCRSAQPYKNRLRSHRLMSEQLTVRVSMYIVMFCQARISGMHRRHNFAGGVTQAVGA